MKAALGYAAVAFSGGAAVVGITALLAGLQLHDAFLLRFGRRCVYAVLIFAVAAAGVMEWALISHDFSLRYVAENNATGTPLLFTITGLWAALEGSILLWAVILGGYLTFVAFKFRKREQDPIVAVAIITGLVVALFFSALMLGPANPFRELSNVPFDGRGPNPLLQNHVLMAFHPPILYLGYVGFTVPFMFGIAALVTGRFGEGWLSDTRRATLVAWGFLTVGIILGAWWSYEVLGWGGFWAWDPVENASFLPWLTATAFIHSVIVQERRGMLRVWNLSLVIATFCLTILGTFLTRSGVIDSVHAFTQSDIGPWLLTFFGIIAATGIGLIAWRGDKLRAPGRVDSAVSRESAFLMNNLLFAALAFVVLLGTVFPLIAEALRGSRLSVGEPYFDRMATPIGLALLFLMAAAPALPWRATSGEVVRNRLLVPAWIGGLTMLAAVILGARGLAEILAYGLGAFATAGIVRQFVLGIRGRRRALGESRAVALGRATRSNPRLYGGLVVHFGVVLIAVVLAASSAYGANRDVKLKKGESATVSGYTVTYLDSHTARSHQKVTYSADIKVQKGDRVLGTYAPAISTYPNSTEGIGTPSVHTGLVDDVYLTLVSSPNAQREITLGVRINALIVWLWIGGAFMALGTILALAPRLRRRPQSISSDDLTPVPIAAPDDGSEPDPREPDAREEVPV
ncbi:MAG TPA: heme lyase CcmF/NrfE family subunit [Acidimicrobiia bacterium]